METPQGLVAQADRVRDEAPGRSAPVRIAGHIPAWASASADLGPVPDSKPIHLTIGISRSPAVQAAFAQFIVEQQRAGSPHFHQWLTPEQIGAQYGPTQHDLDAVTRWLSSQGFVIDSISPSRVAIRVTAPAAVAANALHTQLHFFLSNGRNLQSPTSEPAVPAALAPVVAYIGGLSDIPYTSYVHTRLAPTPPPTRGPNSSRFSQSGTANPDYTASDGTNYQFPDDFNAIYDIAPLLAAGNTGTGQHIAVLGGSLLTASDLTEWESISNLAAYQPNYITPPTLTAPIETNDGNQDEGTLDFERAHGTAPGATVDMLVAQNWLDFTVTNELLNYEIDTLRDPILSLSFGICEAQAPAGYIPSEDSLFMRAAAEGISVFVSSGDSGAAGCETHGQPAPSTPQIASINADCASSYVTCVGGTQFSDLTSPSTYWSATNGPGDGSALGYIPEGAFNEPNGQTAGTFQIFGSGGGPSTVISKPTWQTGAGVPQDGFRDTPDISFSSSDHDGYFACLGYVGAGCTNGRGVVFSGTSAAAPSMAGIAALINQKTGASQGNLNPLLYRTATLAPADFHDATAATSGVASCSTATPSTCNNSTPGPNGLSGGLAGFPLTAGYDLATGLGSLDVLKLATTSALPVAATALTASPSTITISQTVVFTATVTGSGGITPTGTVQFYSNGSALGNPVTLAGGVAISPAESFPLAATYSITASYSGDSSFNGSDSAAFSLVVTNPNAVASTTTLTVTPTTATTAQALTFTAAVKGSKGTATGTIQFLVDGAPQGVAVALVNGSATVNGRLVGAGTHSITAFYAGDNNYYASTSNAVSITITAQSSSTSITISPTTIASTDTVTISTTVTGSGGGPVPTGTVTLMQGTQSLGSLSLDTNGSASGQLSGGGGNPFPVGTFPFDFVYSGDAVYNGSTSPIANLTVTAGTGSGSVSLSANSPGLTASAGASATDNLTLKSTNFSGTQAFTCTIAYNGTGAAASAPTCLVSPTSVTVASNSTASATLTVSTTAAHAITRSGASENRSLPLGPLGGITLAALFFGILPRSRRKLRLARVLSALVFLAGSLTLLSGCGSGGNYNSGSGGGGTPATTAGSYTVTVAANSAAGQSSNVGATLTIPLTVQ